MARTPPGVDPLEGLAELAALVTSRDPPDFLSPPPTSPAADFPAQLERLRRTPREVIHGELRLALDRLPDALIDPEQARTTLAAQLSMPGGDC